VSVANGCVVIILFGVCKQKKPPDDEPKLDSLGLGFSGSPGGGDFLILLKCIVALERLQSFVL